MAQQEIENEPCYTVCVFQDAAWAARGLTALTDQGFTPDRMSVLARQSPEADALIESTFGIGAGEASMEVASLGDVVARGPLVGALQGSDEALGRTGVAATMRRAGFQAHDGVIFETLTSRGGVLVAIESESRAADALALFHAYGGGNAAIGAWRGRV